jgi:septal ring-binding cell division protein DamX
VLTGLATGADLGEPGTQRVCVPSEDGRGWECGTKDNPPPPRGLRERPANADPAPPPFLAHPEYRADAPTARTSEVRAIPEPEPVAPAPTAPDEFTGSGRAEASADVAPTPEPVAEPVTESVAEVPAEPIAEPIVEAPAEPVVEPEPEIVASEPVDSTPPAMLADPNQEPVILAPGPAIAGGEAPPADEPPPAPATTPPADYVSTYVAGDFLALDAARFTVQLARSSSPEGFDTLLTRLNVSSAVTYRVAIDQNGNTTWVLLWGDYPDIESARQAARALPAELVRGAWPRKIGPLQDEARRSGMVPANEPVAASAPAPAAEPEPRRVVDAAPTATSPAPGPTPRDAALHGALDDAGVEAFLALPAQQWTVQLASAGDALAAKAIAASADVEVGSVYVLRLNPTGTPTWVVVAGVHADLTSARALQARVAGALPAASVRRIGPLQAEVRAAR